MLAVDLDAIGDFISNRYGSRINGFGILIDHCLPFM